MPQNGYTVGKDVSIDIITPQGPLRIKARTNFTSKQDTTDKKIEKCDGDVDHLVLPSGWSGKIEIERTGPEIDNYIAAREADYFAGKDIAPISITETIREANGSISQYRYTKVALKYSDAGAKKGNDTVKLSLDWMGSRREKVL